MTDWAPLSAVPTESMVDARLQLHWAAQIVAAVGRTLLEPRPDDSHPNMTWVGGDRLAGNPVGDRAIRAALEPASLTLHVLDPAGSREHVSLEGRTLEDGYHWMEESVGRALGESVVLSRERYTIPTHRVGEGAEFTLTNRTAFQALRNWFHNGDRVLQMVTEGDEGASAVRTWPHHFDSGALIALERAGDPETSPSIGIGMTPGDATYPDPYFYINPYPSPSHRPEWAGPGHWETEAWVGLVLTAPDILSPDASAEHAVTMQFLRNGIETLRDALRT